MHLILAGGAATLCFTSGGADVDDKRTEFLLQASTEGRARGRGGSDLPRNRRELIQLCKEQGWAVAQTASDHTKLTSPAGEVVVMGKRQGDWRALKNIRSLLKRAGLKPAVVSARIVALPRPERSRRPPPASLSVALGAFLEPPVSPDPPAQAPTTANSPMEHLMSANLHSADETSSNVTHLTPAKRGDKRRHILDFIRKVDLGVGVHPDMILDRMRVYYPTITKNSVQIAMAGYARSGWLERKAEGRYRLTAAGEEMLVNEAHAATHAATPATVKPRAARAAPALNLPTEQITTEDLQTLDDALVILDRLDKVIRRHRDIAIACQQLRALIPAPTAAVSAEIAAPTASEQG